MREPQRVTDPTSATGHLVRRASQCVASSWASHVATGLTPPQFAVLSLLCAEQPLDQQTLGERAALDKSTCGYLIDRMERLGLVSASIDPANRRRKLVSVTEQGRELVRETAPQRDRAEEAAVRRLTARETAELNRLLAKMTGTSPAKAGSEPHGASRTEDSAGG